MVRGTLLRRFPGVGVLTCGLLLACLATALLVAQPGDAAEPGQGPVAAYAFDEGTGTTVADTTGHGHTATIEGAKWARGRYGGGLEFKGSEHNVVKIPASTELNFEEEFTLEAWVRPVSSTDKLAPILGKTTGGGSGSKSLSYYLYAGNTESKPYGEIQHTLGTGKRATATTAPPGATWTHLALTYDGATERLYVGGVQVAETATEAPVTTAGELQIGAETEHSEYFSGRIDEVRLYNRVLSGGEVDADLEAPLVTPKAGPIAAYAFDEGTGTTVADTTGHGHTATIEGAKWARGRYGGGLEFKGSEHNVVKIPASTELNFEEEFTLEAWVRPVSSTDKLAPILGKTTGGGSGSKSLSYYLYAGNTESKPYGEIQHTLGTGKRATATTAPPGATWTHLALTYDGATERLYVGGVQVAETATEAPVTTAGELQIGAETEHSEYFSGRIDEVRLYNRVLSGGEVDADLETAIQTPKQGPVAAYAFDEGEGTTVEDLSGDGHTATIEGGTKWATGKYGGALEFSSAGDCASVADAPELRFSEEFTLEGWVRPDGGVYEDPIVVREAGGKAVFGIGLGGREEGEAEGFIGEGSGSKAAVGGEEVRQYEWVHVAATWDGSQIRLYVDGELADTETATAPPSSAEGSLRIGCDTPEGPFGGRIDEVRLYNRTLSEAEVAADMQAPLETPKATPVAAYSFDEGTGATVADTTGDGHTATIEGAEWTTNGRYGDAMEFDATKEDVLKIPASPELNFGEEFTLEAWVLPSGAGNKEAPLIDKQESGGLGYAIYEGGAVSDRPEGAASEEQEFIHANEPLPAHAWNHVSLTFDGNRTYLYVDGELVDNGAAEPTITAEGELEIGGSTDTDDWFDGRIDEVRIYNRGLSEAEVQNDMAAPIQTPQRGPIAAYSFDEGEGTTVEDLTGDGHTATIEGAEWTRGKYGDALKFDGKDQLTIPASEDLNLTEAFTLEAWIRPEEEKEFGHLFVKENAAGTEAAYVITRRSRKLGAYLGEPEAEEFSSEGSLPKNVWRHVAVTYDGARVRLYVNGELEEWGPVSEVISTDGALRIGGGQIWPAGFTGRIDEVRIYDRALSTGEVQETMNSTFPIAVTEIPAEIESEDAIMTGTAQVHGPGTEWYFEYGPTTEYDSIATGEEISGTGEAIELEEAAVDLAPETTYHYRLIAEGPLGTSFGKDKSFVTGSPVNEEVAPNGKFFGIDWSGDLTKMAQPGPKSNAFARIAESGSKFVRFGIGPEHDQAAIENAFKEAKRLGLTAIPYIGEGFIPDDKEAFFKYAKKMIKEFGPGSEYENNFWEIGNEPNMPPSPNDQSGLEKAEKFAVYYEEMVREVRNAELTGVHFLLPGLFGFKEGQKGHISPRAFLKKMLTTFKAAKSPPPNLYDGVSVHPYVFKVRNPRKSECEPRKTTPHKPESTCDEEQVLKEMKHAIAKVHTLKELKQTPVWVTEFGFPVHSEDPENPGKEEAAHPGIGEKEQGILAGQSASMLLQERGHFKIAHAIYYNIEDLPAKPEWAYHAGLFNGNGHPRESWTAFKEVVKGE